MGDVEERVEDPKAIRGGQYDATPFPTTHQKEGPGSSISEATAPTNLK